MGLPLSRIWSDLYLNHIENEFIFTDKNKLYDITIFSITDVWMALKCYSTANFDSWQLLAYFILLSPKLSFTLGWEI